MKKAGFHVRSPALNIWNLPKMMPAFGKHDKAPDMNDLDMSILMASIFSIFPFLSTKVLLNALKVLASLPSVTKIVLRVSQSTNCVMWS